MVDEIDKVQETSDSDLHENGFEFTIKSTTTNTWVKYIALAIVLSIGYIFILIDPVDELILPQANTFSFLIEEQLLGLIIPNIIMIIITPLVWKKVAGLIVNNQVVRSFEAANKKSIAARPMSLLGTIFGMKTFGGDQKYYLEKNAEPSDLNRIGSVFRERILSAISSNIGFTFYVAFLINFLMPSDLTGKDALFLSIMVMQLVPLIISWLVPVNWVLKDVLIRFVGRNRTIYDMGEEMSNGILDKFIGIGGLIVGVNVAYDLAYDSTAAEATNILVAAVYFVFYFLLLSSGTIAIISILYLSGHHGDLVNSIRVKLSGVMPVAETQIENIDVDPSEIDKANPPETGRGRGIVRALGILLLLAVIAYCEYYVLVVIGPFGVYFG